MDLHSQIKEIAKKEYASENPCDVMYATYLGDSLKLDGKPLAVPLGMVDVPKHLTDYDVEVQQVENGLLIGERLTYRIFNALKPGDRVGVVQKFGAQKFLITDRL